MFRCIIRAAIFSCRLCKGKIFVGSQDTLGFGYDMDIYRTVDEIKDRSDAVVIAYYNDEPTEHYFKDDETGMELYSSSILCMSKKS